MKTITVIILFLTLLTTNSATAEETDICADLEQLAKIIMRNRQEGLSMSTMMNATKNVDAPEEIKALNRKMIIRAYEVIQYSSQEYRDDAITEFSNDIALSCYQSKM